MVNIATILARYCMYFVKLKTDRVSVSSSGQNFRVFWGFFFKVDIPFGKATPQACSFIKPEWGTALHFMSQIDQQSSCSSPTGSMCAVERTERSHQHSPPCFVSFVGWNHLA